MASSLTVSEPRGVDVPIYGGALSDQSHPELALGDSGGLVVWTDQRAGYGGLYAARLDSNHQPLDPGGIPLLRGASEAVVAWNGQHYLVVFQRANDIQALRVSAAGQVLDSAPIVISGAPDWQHKPDVAALGSDFLVVWQDRRSGGSHFEFIFGTRVTSEGQVLDPEGVLISQGPNSRVHASVTAGAGRWFVTWSDGRESPTRIRATWVTPEGAVTDPLGLAVSPPSVSAGQPAAAFDGTRFWVAWVGQSAVNVTRVNADGTLQDPTGIRVYNQGYSFNMPNIACGDVCTVVWLDDDQYRADVEAARIGLDGTLLNGFGSSHYLGISPSGVLSGTLKRPGIAATGSSTLFTWAGSQPFQLTGGRGNDVYSRRLYSDGGWQDPVSLRVSLSADPQFSPAVAFNGTHYLAVWAGERDGGSVDLYGARFDTSGAQLGPAEPISSAPGDQRAPALTSNGSDFFAVWEDARAGTLDIYGARVSASGQVLDPQGIPISTTSGSQSEPAVSFDGTHYIVTWQDLRSEANNSAQDIYAARVTQQGAVRDPAGLAVATGGRLQYAPDVDSARDAGVSLIVWHEEGAGSWDTTDVQAGRFLATDGGLGPRLALADAGAAGSPQVAFVRGAWLVTWDGYGYRSTNGTLFRSGVHGGRLLSATAGGTAPFSLAPTVPQPLHIRATELLSDGDNALAVWISDDPYTPSRYELWASYISPEGTVLTPTPRLLSQRPSTATYPYGYLQLGVASHAPRSFLVMHTEWQPAAPYGSYRLASRTVSPQAQGSTCSADVECASGFCADGVCCDSACGGSRDSDCQACSVARGAAVDGTCAPLARGTACRAATDTCDAAEVCDGTALACPADLPQPEGTSCNDNNACTTVDRCQAFTCVGSSPVECTAASACHDVGTCNPATGVCGNPVKPNGSTCSDGNACTQVDSCQAGACVGASPVTCRASDACHDVGTCNPATGACSNPVKPDGSTCSDGNGCTRSDTCQAGVCAGANPVECTAASACHDVGTCNPATGACSSPVKPTGTACDDGNACTQLDACRSGACVGGNPVTCTARDGCHLPGTCDPSTGVCSNPQRANGSACNDGNACTRTDACQAGTCVGGNPVTCTARSACHDVGTCAPATGACSAPERPDGTACTDGNACTTGDVCAAGVCGGQAPGCEPAPECQARACVAGNACALQPVLDGTPCTSGTCRAGACVPAVDAGTGNPSPDAGSGPEPELPPENKGCGCSSGADLFPLAAMLVFLRRRRRS
ncbi:hypothetical protein [Pyxidicoccus trucidator]|uniref:hypothetical protein n=1 Tax=Pyxidicoccus trucidator TaxID=2709662 RepID=UPI0013DD0287|nr:hypothetical protein [Pyxidicoccus trucidator]